MRNRTLHSFLLLSLAGSLVSGVAGCLDVDGDPSLGTTEDELYLEGTLWPGGTVPVCFHTESAARADFATLSPRIRRVVENSWGRIASVSFAGWGTCANNSAPATVVVRLNTDGVANASVGYFPTQTSVMNLGTLRTDFDTAVIHEFGHVLGFGHEMRRPDFRDDSNGNCREGDGTSTNYLGTDPDRTSIMASTGYCQNNTMLSAWDIVGVQRAYGAKARGSIVGAGDRCVATGGATSGEGMSVTVARCNTANGNLWSYWSGSRQLSVALNGNSCARVRGGTVTSTGTTSVLAGACATSNAQQFSFTGVQLRAIGGMCVVARSATSGSALEIQPCGTAGSRERWDVMNGDERMRLSGTSLCVGVPGGTASLGNPLKLEACTIPAATRQKFFFAARTGLIRYGSLCASVLGGKPTPGSQVALWDGCESNPRLMHSVFHLSGQIKSMGQCLSTVGDARIDGAIVGVRACSANDAAQVWDYLW